MKTSKTLVTAALVLGLSGIGNQAQAETTYPEYADPAPVIFKTGKANYNPADGSLYVEVTYRCQDRQGPNGNQHWLKGTVNNLSGGQTQTWQVGNSNDQYGVVQMYCSGRRQTDTIRFNGPGNSWEQVTQPAPRSGTTATITLTAVQSRVWDITRPSGVETTYRAPITLRVPQQRAR